MYIQNGVWETYGKSLQVLSTAQAFYPPQGTNLTDPFSRTLEPSNGSFAFGNDTGQLYIGMGTSNDWFPVTPTEGRNTFGMFYGLTAGTGNGTSTDYGTPIPVKTTAGTGRIPFPRDNGTPTGIFITMGSTSPPALSELVLVDQGTYDITFKIHTTEPGQLQLELDGLDLPETVAVNMNPTIGGHPIIGNAIITTSGQASRLAVVNCTGNAIPLTITSADSSETHANAQSITIRKVA